MKPYIKQILNSPNKTTQVKEYFSITNTEIDNKEDIIIVDLHTYDTEYNSLVMEKGLTFPLPEKNDILFIENLTLKFNEKFELKLYIKGNFEKKNKKGSNEQPTKKDKSFSFNKKNIFSALSKISEENLPSYEFSIFQIVKITDDVIELKDIFELNTYKFKVNNKKKDLYSINNYLLIYNFDIEKDIIILQSLTIFEILNEEKLIKYFNNNYYEGADIFKVIDKDQDNILLINIERDVYILDGKNKIISKHNIDLCSIILITNFKRTKKNNFYEIILTEKSFIHVTGQNIYYSKDIFINSLTIIKFTFLDYKDNNNNLIDLVSGDIFDEMKISNKEDYIIFEGYNKRKFEYYPIKITLKSTKSKEVSKTFIFYLYEGLLNKINAFLNVNNSIPTFFYEFLYYNLEEPLENVEKRIIINNELYTINIGDNFGSKNRKRLSILNVPYQKIEKKENELNSNSIQVCELTQGDLKKIIGIYDIHFQNIESDLKNDIFDQYYQDFGDIYDVIDNSSPKLFFNLYQFLLEKATKFKALNTNLKINDTNIFEEEMTLSQLKIRIGLLISYYINKYKNNQMKIFDIINELIQLFPQLHFQQFKYQEIIRIIVFIFREKIDNNNKLNIKLILVSLLPKNSPYSLAYNFNKSEIQYLDEFSPLFQGYLQLDSFIGYNYIHNRHSYSFSLELLFMMRHQLINSYESFFFTEKSHTKEIAITDSLHQITIINETALFDDKDINNNSVINNLDIAKNYAMPISMGLKHENGGHYKYLLKNLNISAPLFYYRKLNIEIEVDISHSLIRGESGALLENFICPDKEIIYELSTKLIYGDLLKIEYFIGKDFKLLINEVKKRMSNNNEPKFSITINDNKKKGTLIANSLNDYETLSLLPPIFYHGDMILDINRLKENIISSKDKIRETSINRSNDIKRNSFIKRNFMNRFNKKK